MYGRLMDSRGNFSKKSLFVFFCYLVFDMIFVIWTLRCWIATFPLPLRSRVLFNPKGIMGHGVGPHLGLYVIGSLSLMMIFIIINYLFNRTF